MFPWITWMENNIYIKHIEKSWYSEVTQRDELQSQNMKQQLS